MKTNFYANKKSFFQEWGKMDQMNQLILWKANINSIKATSFS